MSKEQARRFETVLIERDKAPDIAVVCKLLIEKINRKELKGIDKRKV
jgi:hypothetical protein